MAVALCRSVLGLELWEGCFLLLCFLDCPFFLAQLTIPWFHIPTFFFGLSLFTVFLLFFLGYIGTWLLFFFRSHQTISSRVSAEGSRVRRCTLGLGRSTVLFCTIMS